MWPNGAEAVCISSESGEDSPRGLNTQLILVDELASYGSNEGIVHQALLTLRHAPSKMVIMTTPKSTPLLLEYYDRAKSGDDNIRLITGSTYDNASNLSKAFMEGVVSKYEGTHLAQEELYGNITLSNPSSLWSLDTIKRNLVKESSLPYMTEYCLGVDPALLSKKSNVGKKTGRKPDSCGIILSGRGEDGFIYTLDSFTGSYSPEKMVEKVCDIYDMFSPMAPMTIFLEINNLGEETVKMMFRMIDRLDVFKVVKPYFSTLSKMARAQPYSLMAQQDKIKYVDKSALSPLFNELSSYVGDGKSPDFLDSAIFSWSGLSPVKKSFTNIQELII